MTELLLFASTFVSVAALGFQSLNVNQGHYVAAFLTSFAISGGHLALYRYMPQASILQMGAYFLGGAVVYTRKAREVLMQLPREAVSGMRSASEPYALLLARTARERFSASPVGCDRNRPAINRTCAAVFSSQG